MCLVDSSTTADPGFFSSLLKLMFVASLLCSPAHAVNPDLMISQYAHTAWRLQEGYFTNKPSAMAQTTDGYLWMATRVGLLRFDGVRFVPFFFLGGKRLPSGGVQALLAARDGSLWIGASGGLVQWKNNDLISYPTLPGTVA
jgi:ligand-binding sensor domain-containing protein